MASWDRRNGSNADLPNNIDVLTSRSTDGGRTWSAQAVLAAHDGGSTSTTANGRGDCCLTVNRVTGRIFAHYIRSPATIGISNSDNTTSNTSTTTIGCAYRYSDDDGVTWSAETIYTATVKTTAMYGTSASSGHGFCDVGGTVYVPYCFTDSTGGRNDFVMYSANNGTTWARSTVVGPGVDEHHIALRSDGYYLSNARPTGTTKTRLLSLTNNLTTAWSGPFAIATLPDPQCNGDLLRVDPSDSSPMATWLLASGCASTGTRQNLTVWMSKDGGTTWPYAWTVYRGGAAYSSMVRLGVGQYGIFWEDTDTASLLFTTFTLTNLAY